MVKRRLPPFGGRSVKRKIFDDTDREATAAVLAESVEAVSYLSIRQSANRHVGSLAAAAVRSLARGFHALYIQSYNGEIKEDADVQTIRLLPPNVAQRLLGEILVSTPASNPLAISTVALFLSAETTSFDLSVGQTTLKASAPLLQLLQHCRSLSHLDLSRQSDLKDHQLAPLFAELPNLEDVRLGGCTQIGDASVIALSKATEDRLLSVNLNFTATTRKALISLMARGKNLEVLKIANLNGLTDSAIQAIVSAATETAIGWQHVPLSRLKKLKLRSCAVSDAGVGRLLGLTPFLESLDVSFTDLHSLDFIPLALAPSWRINKLVLSGLKLRRDSLNRLLRHVASLPNEQRGFLGTLKIGSMGLGRQEARMLISGAPSIVDLDSLALQSMLSALNSLNGLRILSLHGNIALQRRADPLFQLFARIVPRLTKLDLTGVRLTSNIVMGLYEADEEQRYPSLETAILDNTGLDDEGLAVLQKCAELRELHLVGCRITERGLKQLVDNCQFLSVLNLTGCRGVSLAARRDFFRAWQDGDLSEGHDLT